LQDFLHQRVSHKPVNFIWLVITSLNCQHRSVINNTVLIANHSFYRWLLENAKPKAAKNVFLKIAKINRKTVTVEFEKNFEDLVEKSRVDWKDQTLGIKKG
jgi:hypothetical protein